MSEPGDNEYGKWDPDASNDAARWWETPKHQQMFTTWLRVTIDLGPIPAQGRQPKNGKRR